MIVTYDENFGRKVEAVAETMWDEDAVIATGKPRAVAWSSVQGLERDRWTRLAQVALQQATAVEAYAAAGIERPSRMEGKTA